MITPPAALVLASDYGATTPLWHAGRNVNNPGPLRLDPDLLRDLLSWQAHFNEHFGVDRWPNWDTVADKSWHRSEGEALHQRLVDALPDRVITLDLWPVEDVEPQA